MLESISSNIYSGCLAQYTYPENIECQKLLQFLKRVINKKRVHLTDVNYWKMPYPLPEYEIYIVCAFGEFVNEDFIHTLDEDPLFTNKHIILITSQYYQPTNLKNVKVFYLEHMHTIVDYFCSKTYTKLSERSHCHGLLSRRNAVHKSLVLNRLYNNHVDSLLYTICNIESTEFQIQNLAQDSRYILGVKLSEQEVSDITALHNNPISIPGHQWSVNNNIYNNTKLNWAVESIFLSREFCPTAYLTEKIIKPIVAGSCFVLVSQQHSYQRLKSWGFETFENIFQLDFDQDTDPVRLEKIYHLIDTTDFNDILCNPEIQQAVDYNHAYFFGDFVKNIDQSNEPRIEEIIKYINEL
jgi:hypothetical protein